MNLCTHCGHPLPPRAKFCIRCGTPAATRDPEETALRSELADVLPTASTPAPAEGTAQDPQPAQAEPAAAPGRSAQAAAELPESTAETLPRPEVDAAVAAARAAGNETREHPRLGADDETREHPRLDLSPRPAVPPSDPVAPASDPVLPAAEAPSGPLPATAGLAAESAASAIPDPAPAIPAVPASAIPSLTSRPELLEFEPWLTDEIDELPDEPPAEPPVRQHPLLARWRALRGKTRAGVLGGVAAVVVFVVMVTLIVVAQGAARGGATSPQDAVDRFAEALVAGDLGTALAMVAPDERDALERIRSAAAEAFGSLALGDAVRSVDGRAGTPDLDLSLAGVTIAVTGLAPSVSRLGADLAVARLARGTVAIDVDPDATEGLLRTALATQAQPERRIHRSFDLAAEAAAPTLMLRRVSGLWYVSPLFTALEYTVGVNGVVERSPAGTELVAAADGAAGSRGAATPEAAAEAFAKAFGAATTGESGPLATSVQHSESPLVTLYGDALLRAAGIPAISVESVSFVAGARDGARVQARLRSLDGLVDGAPLHATATCVSRDGERTCLNGSGYVPAGTNGLLTLAADRGAFSLTAVQEPDGWRIGLVDTLADHAIHWLRSLTREQALATLGLERATSADVALVPDAETTVSFNTAGYATRTLRLDHSATVRWTTDDVTATAYDAKGEGRFIGSWSGTELTAGDYTLVLHAGRDWDRAFAEKGDKVAYSATIRLLKY